MSARRRTNQFGRRSAQAAQPVRALGHARLDPGLPVHGPGVVPERPGLAEPSLGFPEPANWCEPGP